MSFGQRSCPRLIVSNRSALLSRVGLAPECAGFPLENNYLASSNLRHAHSVDTPAVPVMPAVSAAESLYELSDCVEFRFPSAGLARFEGENTSEFVTSYRVTEVPDEGKLLSAALAFQRFAGTSFTRRTVHSRTHVRTHIVAASSSEAQQVRYCRVCSIGKKGQQCCAPWTV